MRIVLMTALALVVLAAAGCGVRADAPASQAPAVSQTETASDGSTPAAPEAGSTSENDSSLDLDEIEGQLDAMQSELDGLEMPSDSDFDEAESAIY
jgi:TolA-binding protein